MPAIEITKGLFDALNHSTNLNQVKNKPNERKNKMKGALVAEVPAKPIDYDNPLDKDGEFERIKSGEYQTKLYQFTYDNYAAIFQYKNQPVSDYEVHPLLNRPGLRCSAAVATDRSGDTIELHINFVGTIDFASKHADIDDGGPGQETLKKHEKELINKVNDMVLALSKQHPDKKIRLRVAGHSLGGALAKGFVHTIQRACIAQEEGGRDAIMTRISDAGFKHSDEARLRKKLNSDKEKFKNMTGLSQISGVTLYALGSPGVSRATDEDATALSHAHDRDFIRVYNHCEEGDITRRFGESEFLSGRYGKPNVKVNKAIRYEGEVDEYRKGKVQSLPFPGMTRTVMAKHNLTVLAENHKRALDITALMSEKAEEKFDFSVLHWALFKVAFTLASIISVIINKTPLAQEESFFYSYPEEDVALPVFGKP
ncbi:hypothetical protein [Legionella taurinensis]|uniref:Uncharacterized protein n=1 Tax=Legionella taurinensis TaxID=70611 RepID=A0A3A5LXI5_9GAMM|nr:hypothetical protein [Legionella taurinensis]RJT47326.1 hypothetical protein D6J04_07085 [Legionella taurinensis]RJT68601.1 hypothetical protein D6J03_03995 [Legionella taurinensis]